MTEHEHVFVGHLSEAEVDLPVVLTSLTFPCAHRSQGCKVVAVIEGTMYPQMQGA